MYETNSFPELNFTIVQSKIDHQNSIAAQEKQG